MRYPFEYRKLGDFTYHVLSDPNTIKVYLVDRILREWELDPREWSLPRGVSTEPLLVNRNGFELMDGYTRYAVLKRHEQKEAYACGGSA